jgi:membrane associated rhomboid family serine protease
MPIRDTNRSEKYPVINNSIIGVSVLAFLVELLQGRGLREFIYLYGLVPARSAELQIAAGTSGQSGGIAWGAHIGGFLSGIVFLKLFETVPKRGVGEKN